VTRDPTSQSVLPAPAPTGFTLAEVTTAFAAERLPLKVDHRDAGTVYLNRANAPMGDVEVSVHPQHMLPGALLVIVMQGERVVRVRNVIVDFNPRSSSARKARAALARLRLHT
jgi:hypothetical protein